MAKSEKTAAALEVTRHEIKYYLNPIQYTRLSQALKSAMLEDKHNGPDGYPIRSLYFDTYAETDFYQKLAGIEERKKIRLRTYSPDSAQVKLEIKRKFGNEQVKKSAIISREGAQKLMACDYDALLTYDNRIAREIYEVMRIDHARPVVLIEYMRKAFIHSQAMCLRRKLRGSKPCRIPGWDWKPLPYAMRNMWRIMGIATKYGTMLAGLRQAIGHGFCRYSTDRRFLVPHFEKMLNDNALLILVYSRAHALTGAAFYARAARETANYILREMRGPEGGFYSAQDADSEGEEGKYYTFTHEEVLTLLGQEPGHAFCVHYGISPLGNFEGKSIPNLLHEPQARADMDDPRKKLYAYRLGRYPLHLDDKCLAAWNGLMIAALADLSQTLGEDKYLDAAREADVFLRENLLDGESLRVSFRDGQRGAPGFLEDYAFYGLGLVALYDATLEEAYLARAMQLAQIVLRDFYDAQNGGFYLAGRDNERLLFAPKPTYDGALPSGNAAMAHLLLALFHRTVNADMPEFAKKQMAFMAGEAQRQPAGYSFFLCALLLELYPPAKLVCVQAVPIDRAKIRAQVPMGTTISMLEGPEEGYALLNGRTTFYACKGQTCLPPANELEGLL